MIDISNLKFKKIVIKRITLFEEVFEQVMTSIIKFNDRSHILNFIAALVLYPKIKKNEMKKAIELINFSSYKKNEINPDDDIITALNIMVKNKIDFVAVSIKNEYYGLLTEIACLKNYITNSKKYKNIKVKELMLKDLPYINHYDSIENCIKLMITYNVNYIPVFNDIKFCGIITMKDILFEIENEEFQEVEEFELDSAFNIHMIL